MMAFRNEFVVAVKVGGKVQRDAKGDHTERNVFLPHDTEYTLLLKNLTDRRAVAAISIDGTDVLGGRRIVVAGHGEAELQRFMLDNNRDKGQAFRFVSVDSKDEGIVDPSSPENGLIEVSFFHEQVQWKLLSQPFIIHPASFPVSPYTICDASVRTTPISDMSKGCTVNYCASEPPATQDLSAAGATVEGKQIEQSFSDTSFQIESWSCADIKLRLKVRQGVQVHSDGLKHFCQHCGKKVEPSFNHCPYCGFTL